MENKEHDDIFVGGGRFGVYVNLFYGSTKPENHLSSALVRAVMISQYTTKYSKVQLRFYFNKFL